MSDDTGTADAGERRIRIDLWVDIACPWCYVGKARLERAVRETGRAELIDIRVHTFELDPSAPSHPHPNPAYVADHMGVSEAQARAMEARMADTAFGEGLAFEIDRIHANSFDALRLLHLAGEHGRSLPC